MKSKEPTRNWTDWKSLCRNIWRRLNVMLFSGHPGCILPPSVCVWPIVIWKRKKSSTLCMNLLMRKSVHGSRKWCRSTRSGQITVLPGIWSGRRPSNRRIFPFLIGKGKKNLLPMCTIQSTIKENCIWKLLPVWERPYPQYFPQSRLWVRKNVPRYSIWRQRRSPEQ